jgi:hypothetical protein
LNDPSKPLQSKSLPLNEIALYKPEEKWRVSTTSLLGVSFLELWLGRQVLLHDLEELGRLGVDVLSVN